MDFKRIISLIMSLVTVLALASCGRGEEQLPDEPETASASDSAAVTTDSSDTDINENEAVSNTVVSLPESTELSADPTQWSVAQIVEAYKTAAAKSESSVTSGQVINLSSISINNGQYEGVMNFVTSIMSKLFANNATEKEGITGGYENLSEADIASAKAYKSGNNIVIEMVMKEQTSGARGDAESGSVGHAITAVGDIGQVVDQIADLGLPMEISEKDTKIRYTKPVVKVLIDSNGKIVKGTWSYTVDIGLNNYKVAGKTVETTSVVLDNIITVNGGFEI